ncbi:MAG: serine/threonine protein kinase [Planctomycetota bacterium]|nr:serine/threonine protein kinase [Planctomycetota bacterium]
MSRASDHLSGLTDEAERRLERLFAAFDAAWNHGSAPRIERYLPSGPLDERRAALVELVFIDLEYRLKADPTARIERYLGEHPELVQKPDILLELAVQEFQLRHQGGRSPDPGEYLARFPDLAPRLAARLGDAPGASSDSADVTRTFSGRAPITLVDDAIPESLPDDGPVRYHRIRPYARGGLGEVFVAEDLALHREVALKRIRPQYATDPAVRRRFLREVEITARLDHPGIAPIHELIYDQKGRPWYVMRFVKGKTFRAEIEQFYTKEKGQASDGADRALEFRNMLGRFVSVCETMVYAHRRGVVHRDLTPSNVMLGDYGETIVLDWGLATASGESHEGVANPTMISSPPDASLMMSGQLLGTPAFMAPEQADGRQSAIGPATDVYCLGAILYMIVTGRPPYQGHDLVSVLKKIQAGEFDPPRQVRADVPPALQAICLKAMCIEPKGRYDSPRDLARDIERWMADEVVSVYREPIAERARRWAGKHRTAITTTTAVLLLAAILGGYSWISSLNRRWRVESEVQVTLDRAVRIGSQARDKSDLALYGKAVSEIEDSIAKLTTVGGSSPQRSRAEGMLASLKHDLSDTKFERDLDEARLLGASVEDGHFNTHAKVSEYKRLFRENGLDLDNLSNAKAAELVRSSRLRERLVAVLDDLVLDEPSQRYKYAGIADSADGDETSKRFRHAMIERDLPTMRKAAHGLEIGRLGAIRLYVVGNALYKVRELDEAARFLDESRQLHANDFWINLTLTQVLSDMKPPQLARAIPHYAAAIALRPDSPGVHLNYGNARLAIGDVEGALSEYRQAIKQKPEYAQAHYALGYGLASRQLWDAAIAEYRAAIRFLPDYAEAYNAHVVAVFQKEGNPDRAINEFREALKLESRDAGLHYGLGTALRAGGNTGDAIEEFGKATQLKAGFFWAHHSRGNALQAIGRFDEAIGEHRTAVDLRPEYWTHYGLGMALKDKGDAKAAIVELRETVTLNPDFAPGLQALVDCLKQECRFSDMRDDLKLASRQQSKDVAPSFAKDLAEAERLVALEPRFLALLKGQDKAASTSEQFTLGQLCYYKKMYAAAARFWDEAFTADPRLAEDRTQPYRYNAACVAVLAGTGQGKDDPAPDEASRSKLRGLARKWLKAELDGYSKQLEGDKPEDRKLVSEVLEGWKGDGDLAGVRDPGELPKLPRSESEAWHSLWDDVELTLLKAQGKVIKSL